MDTGSILSGIKVLDLTRVLAGPFCTMLLGDMGADVIKIEEPKKGDDTRSYPPFIEGGFSAYFGNMNRNKKSITLNLKNSEGKKIFLELVKKSDVIVENYRPGTMEKLGLGRHELEKLNPALVFASISGFGQYGRYRDRPGYDIIAQALGGLMSVSGWPDSPPTRSGTALGDVLGGLNCCIGILAALLGRTKTGKGQGVDVALVDSVVSAMETIVQIYLVEGRVPGRIGNRYEFIAPYDCFQALDGWVVIACGNDTVWQRFCTVIGREDLITKEEYSSNASRVKQHKTLKSEVEEWSRKICVDEIVNFLIEKGIPCAPVNTVDQVVNDPHIVEDREMLVEMKTPGGQMMKAVACPIKFSESKTYVRHGPPALGEHSEEILRQYLGMNCDQIEKLRAAGALN